MNRKQINRLHAKSINSIEVSKVSTAKNRIIYKICSNKLIDCKFNFNNKPVYPSTSFYPSITSLSILLVVWTCFISILLVVSYRSHWLFHIKPVDLVGWWLRVSAFEFSLITTQSTRLNGTTGTVWQTVPGQTTR